MPKRSDNSYNESIVVNLKGYTESCLRGISSGRNVAAYCTSISARLGNKGIRQCIGCGCDKNGLHLAYFHVKKCEERK